MLDNFILLSTYFTFEGKTAFKHTVSYVLVSKEQSGHNKEESAHAVQEEEKQPKPDAEKCLTGDSNKPTSGNSLASAKKRKTVEMSEKKRKKKKV